MGFWTVFGACFASLWAVCSVIAIPISVISAERIIYMEGNRLKGFVISAVAIIAGPLLIGVALVEFFERCKD